MKIRCYFPKSKMTKWAMINPLLQHFSKVDLHGVISFICGWLAKVNKNLAVPAKYKSMNTLAGDSRPKRTSKEQLKKE
jgi:hypothetical protein